MDEKVGDDLPTLRIHDDDTPKIDNSGTLPERSASRSVPERAVQIGLAGVSIILLWFLAGSLLPELPSYYRYNFKPAAARYWPNAAVVLTLLVVGYNLYLLRGYKRLWFGIAELILSTGLGWYAMNKAASGAVPDAIVILFAALYLAGRGFVNISRRLQPLQIPDEDGR